MKFSYLLATCFEPLAQRTIASLRQGGYEDYEIVVCSPFPIEGDRIVWTKEEKMVGSCQATRQAFEHSTGDVCGVGPDDVVFIPGAMAEFMKEYQEYPHDLWDLRSTWTGTVFGKMFFGYPCTSRETITKLYRYFYPYVHGGGDPCFSLGAHRHGIQLRWPKTQVMDIASLSDRLGCGLGPHSTDSFYFEWCKQQLIKEFPEYSQGWDPTGIAIFR